MCGIPFFGENPANLCANRFWRGLPEDPPGDPAGDPAGDHRPDALIRLVSRQNPVDSVGRECSVESAR